MQIDKNIIIPNEDYARKFLSNLRWGNMASCPYCENPKAYFIENGKRYKCANKVCYKKFSVTTKTLMEATNIPLGKWLLSVRLFSEKKGKIEQWDLEKQIDVSPKTAFLIINKLIFTLKYIDLEFVDSKQMQREVFEAMFNLYDKIDDVRPNYFLKDIDNISDSRQLQQVIAYAKHWLSRCHWIHTFTNSIQAREIVSETFLYIADNNIKEYNADTIMFYIRKVTNNLWAEYFKSHPNVHNYIRRYDKQWKRDAILNLKPTYLNSKIRRAFPEKTASEVMADKELQKRYKERLKLFRQKFNLLEGFNSHFD